MGCRAGKYAAVLGLILGLWVMPNPGIAQDRDPGERLLDETLRQRELERLSEGVAGQQIATPDPQGPVAETPCFAIDEITLTGTSVFGPKRFQPIFEAFSGQCLGQVSINNLLARITALYADAGYITTRAYIPAQDISTGRLKVEVLEGRIEAYIYQQTDAEGQARPGVPRKLKMAMPQQPGDVFQLRDLEHGLEQMNRLRSSQANANLVAGQGPGTSRIAITETKSDTIRGSFGLNNRGSETTGTTQVSFGLEADDLLRLNDTWSLSYSGSRNTNALALAVSVPYRKWLISASGSYSEEFTPLTAASDLFTQSATASLTAERLLYRGARSKLYGYGTISSYWNKRYINIVALSPQHRSAARFGLRQEHRLEKAVIAADTSLSIGSTFLGADWDGPGLPAGSPRADFTKLSARLTYLRPFESGKQLNATLVGQYSARPLYSNEQLSIGGWDSVRGYSGFAVSGDSGAYLRTELSFPAFAWDARRWGKPFEARPKLNPFRQATGGMRPFVFLDGGYVFAHSTGQEARMASTGFGFSAQLGKTTLNGALAIPLVDQNGQNAGDIQAYLGLTVKLF